MLTEKEYRLISLIKNVKEYLDFPDYMYNLNVNFREFENIRIVIYQYFNDERSDGGFIRITYKNNSLDDYHETISLKIKENILQKMFRRFNEYYKSID